MQRRGGSFEVTMKKFGFYGLMQKEGVRVLPDLGSAGGHTGERSKKRVSRKRETSVMVSAFVLA